jgi:hypothetical protein
MKNKKKNKKKNNGNKWDAEDYQEITRRDGMKKNKRRNDRHNQKRDLKYYTDNS